MIFGMAASTCPWYWEWSSQHLSQANTRPSDGIAAPFRVPGNRGIAASGTTCVISNREAYPKGGLSRVLQLDSLPRHHQSKVACFLAHVHLRDPGHVRSRRVAYFVDSVASPWH